MTSFEKNKVGNSLYLRQSGMSIDSLIMCSKAAYFVKLCSFIITMTLIRAFVPITELMDLLKCTNISFLILKLFIFLKTKCLT